MDEICRINFKEKNRSQTKELSESFPCKVCILLAVCKSCKEIRCDTLWEILKKAAIDNGKEDAITLDYIKEFFPNSKEIFKYTITENPHVSFRWKDKDSKW